MSKVRTQLLSQAEEGLRSMWIWGDCKDAEVQLVQEESPPQGLIHSHRNDKKQPMIGWDEASACVVSSESSGNTART